METLGLFNNLLMSSCVSAWEGPVAITKEDSRMNGDSSSSEGLDDFAVGPVKYLSRRLVDDRLLIAMLAAVIAAKVLSNT